ncbi:MAG: T9SS type A sorting domain-containing protein [Bacteroidetes bacterium]|nr:T9SS type A sorting domain-containing protein [Bacteroidota bacterium]
MISDSKSVIKVFPNPASTFIIIEYNCESDGELILHNSLGQEILKTSLEKGNQKVQLQINDIANGIYQYKCKFENCIEQIGKLTIQK